MTVQQVLTALDRPEPDDRPMMRWWWFGPDVERAEIERELRAMAAAGLGGAEVALVYPLRPGAPDYLGDEPLAMLGFAAETARDLGLRLDVTLGSGWSYGGAHIGPEHASRRLHWERRDMGPAAQEISLVPGWPGDAVIGVHLGDGFPPSRWRSLSPQGTRLRIPAGRGPRTVLIAWSRTTGQQVKRAAAGAEGPVVDHLSADAVRHHLDVVGERILRAVPAELLGSVFSDSLEVYAASWTAGLPSHFEARRGYDPLPLLHLLEVDAPGAPEFREDMGRTLSELVEESFVHECTKWAREHGVAFRLQGYGEPPITMSAQRGVDLIEGEGAGWTALTQSRWASSAAHLDRREVVSSEIWTWVHSPSFRATPLDLLGEAHEHLLLGITRFVGHGWPYSAPDAPGLGWTFYAAGALDDRNAWWPAMPQLTAYLSRMCAALRQGEPGADVALYLPYADVRAARGAGHDLWRACRAHVGEAIPAAVRRAGYDLDLIDDDALADLDPASYPLVVLPRVTRLPVAAEAWLDRVREAGGYVLAVDSPAYTAGIAVQSAADAVDAELLVDHATLSMVGAAADGGAGSPLAEALASALPPPLGLEGGGGEIGVVRRRLGDGDLYLLANTGPHQRTITARPREPRAHLSLHDAATGRSWAVDPGAAHVTLHPYQAVLLLATDAPLEVPTREAGSRGPTDAAGGGSPSEIPLEGPWTVCREGEQPRATALPFLLHGAEAADLRPLLLETAVTLSAEQAAGPLLLDLGEGTPQDGAGTLGGGGGYRTLLEPPVREIAIVEIDGEQAGILWRAPFVLDLTGRLPAGSSTVRLRIHGTTAPAAASPENATAGETMVAAAHAAYGERFQQQELDRMLEGTALGLGTVPVLRCGGLETTHPTT